MQLYFKIISGETFRLAATIKSFHKSVQIENEVHDLKSRVSNIEYKLSAAADKIRKEDPPSKKRNNKTKSNVVYISFVLDNQVLHFIISVSYQPKGEIFYRLLYQFKISRFARNDNT